MSERAGPVDERPMRLEVHGRTLDAWTASPGHADALAAGRLLAEGFIRGRDDLLQLLVEEAPAGTIVRARVPVVLAEAAFARLGPLPADDAPPGGPQPTTSGHPRPDRPRAALPALSAFAPLFRQLFASAELYEQSGGLHSAALSDGARLLHTVEEVGRHNAVDKAIGLGLLAGNDLTRLGLVLSARVSGAMASKAARAGLAWVASRSVPTTMAVTVAESAGLPIVARAAGKEPYVYAASAPAGDDAVPVTGGT